MTPREKLAEFYPEAIQPMDLLKKRFSGSVKWVCTHDGYEVGANPFPEPGYVWTPYEAPKVKRAKAK